MGDNRTYAYNWLLQRGYAPHQAAAVVGNLVQESRVNPSLGDDNAGDAGTARGIAQWRGSRLAGLYNFAASNNQQAGDLGTQLAYLHHELQGPERNAGNALRAAPDVVSATKAFIGYERPQGWTTFTPELGHGYANRLSAARSVLGQGDQAPTQVATAPAEQTPGEPLANQFSPALVAAAIGPATLAEALPSPATGNVSNDGGQAVAAYKQALAEQARRKALFTQPIAALYG